MLLDLNNCKEKESLHSKKMNENNEIESRYKRNIL